METIFWISVGLFIISFIVVVILVRKNNKLYANQDQIPGLLDSSDLSEEDMGLQFSEQPFIECY